MGLLRICFDMAESPAPGYRRYASGETGSFGNAGYSWSSATYGIYGLDLNFFVTWFYAGGAYYRAYGFQLRCLAE